MKKSILIILVFSCSLSAFAKQNVVYKYKQYEKFDLGDLEIKGSIIAPGDLSVKERRRKIFKRKLYRRKDFDEFIQRDIKFIR
jgi:hypothetical protein